MELVVVIAIIAILATIALPGVFRVLEKSRNSADRTSAKSYENAIKLHLVNIATSGKVAALPTDEAGAGRIANAITKEVGTTTSFTTRTEGWRFYVEPSSGRVVAEPEPGPGAGWVVLPEGEVAFKAFNASELP